MDKSLIFALSSVIGPVLGGWITDSLNWRWAFYVNLPLGILALGVLPLVLPQNARQSKARIDYLGALMITILQFGAGLMSLGIFLLTTLQSGSSPVLVSSFLFVMALGMGMINPATMLAVQTAVEPRVLGVATSATQFIRLIGTTAGTAMIGTLVTSGYVTRLAVSAPPGTPQPVITALHSPNALVNQEALQSLAQLMATVPNSVQMTQTLLDTARIGLANAIQDGFFFMFGAAILAIVGAFLTANLRLDRTQETAVIAIAHGLGDEAV